MEPLSTAHQDGKDIHGNLLGVFLVIIPNCYSRQFPLYSTWQIRRKKVEWW